MRNFLNMKKLMSALTILTFGTTSATLTLACTDTSNSNSDYLLTSQFIKDKVGNLYQIIDNKVYKAVVGTTDFKLYLELNNSPNHNFSIVKAVVTNNNILVMLTPEGIYNYNWSENTLVKIPYPILAGKTTRDKNILLTSDSLAIEKNNNVILIESDIQKTYIIDTKTNNLKVIDINIKSKYDDFLIEEVNNDKLGNIYASAQGFSGCNSKKLILKWDYEQEQWLLINDQLTWGTNKLIIGENNVVYLAMFEFPTGKGVLYELNNENNKLIPILSEDQSSISTLILESSVGNLIQIDKNGVVYSFNIKWIETTSKIKSVAWTLYSFKNLGTQEKPNFVKGEKITDPFSLVSQTLIIGDKYYTVDLSSKVHVYNLKK